MNPLRFFFRDISPKILNLIFFLYTIAIMVWFVPKVVKVKLATVDEGDEKAPFSIATTPRCKGGRYSFL